MLWYHSDNDRILPTKQLKQQSIQQQYDKAKSFRARWPTGPARTLAVEKFGTRHYQVQFATGPTSVQRNSELSLTMNLLITTVKYNIVDSIFF